MYGEESQLTPDERAEIRNLLAMQHRHVHRGESNVVFFLADMIQEGQLPSIAPEFDLGHGSIYANTAACAAWSHVRVLQYVSDPRLNSTEWSQQWAILDDAFRFYVSGVNWGAAFAKLIDTSFAFDADTVSRQLDKTRLASDD